MGNKFFNSINTFRTKHEPEILMAMGLAGLCSAVVLAVRSTIIATKKCEAKKEAEQKDKLTFKEVIKETWKLYLPVAITTAVSIPCIIAGNRISSKRNAALAAAYTLSETALSEYQQKTKELVGEEKAKEIETAVTNDKLANKEVLITEEGEQLFYEPLTDRYFKSSWNKLMQSCNELNEEALGSTTGSYTLNDWFAKIGLDYADVGDVLGWSTPTYGNSDGLMKISIDSALTKDNKPCACIHYDIKPYVI